MTLQITLGGNTYSLAYLPSGTISNGTCSATGVWYACVPANSGKYLAVWMWCDSGNVKVAFSYGGTASDCSSPAGFVGCGAGTINLVDYTCYPFHFHFQDASGQLVTATGSSDIYIDDISTPATSCPCNVMVGVADCGTPELGVAGATVTVKQSGTTVATCTTDSLGSCCIGGLLPGSYHIDVTKSGYPTWSDNFTYTGGSFGIVAYIDTTHYYYWHITGCTGADLAGATVSINGGTYSSDSSGLVKIIMPTGTYSYTISKSRFVSTTDTLTVTRCGSGQVHRSVSGAVANIGGAAAGYYCDFNCNIPIAETLHVSDGVLGGFTIFNNGTGSGWIGSKTVSYPGTTGPFRSPCFGDTGTLCPSSSGVLVQYGLLYSGGVATLTANYSPTSGSNHCPHTDTGVGLQVTGCTLVSLACNPFDSEWTHDYCDCTIGGHGCNVTNTLWPGSALIPISVTE